MSLLQLRSTQIQPHMHHGTEVEMMSLPGATYITSEDMHTLFHSTGAVTTVTWADLGSGNLQVSGGSGYIRDMNDETAMLYNFDWSGNTLAIPSNTLRYVGVKYNGGTPILYLETSFYNFDFNTNFTLLKVYNEAGVLYVVDKSHRVGNHAGAIIRRLYGQSRLQRDNTYGGLYLSETGTRNLILSAGRIFSGLAIYPIASKNTSGADRFTAYYRIGANWTSVVNQAQWDNTNYNNTASGLVALGTGKYTNHYWYVTTNGDLIKLYGLAEYSNISAASADTVPSIVPPRLQVDGILIGRTIFQKSAATYSVISSSWDTVFNRSVITDHTLLTNIGSNTHTQIDSHINSTTIHNDPFAISQASHGFVNLDVIRHNGTQWTKAQADSTSTLGMAVVISVTDSSNFWAGLNGRHTVNSHGLTVGSRYYLSAATPGAITTTAPTNAQIILTVDSSNTIILSGLFY